MVLQSGPSVLVDYIIGHWDGVNDVLMGYMTSMGVGENDGAENA
jgi:hypothetical protein